MIRVFAIAACTFFLGACAAASRQNVFPRHYTLGTAAAGAAAPATPAGRAMRHGVLRVARIEMPDWLQGNALHYRLAYRDDAAIASYADSDWAAPPAGMLAHLLRTALAPDWQAVLDPSSTAEADATLHVRVADFCQVFSSPAASVGVLDATVTLVTSAGRVVAQRHFHLEVPAPTPDAAGGVRALDGAAREFAQRASAWAAAQRSTR